MKKVIITISVLSLFFTSCKKDLIETPYSQFSNLNTPALIDAAAVGIYGAVDNSTISFFHQTALFPMVEVGHRYSSFGSGGEIIGNREFYRYIYNANTTAIAQTWQGLYLMVNRANEVIEAAQANIKDSAIAIPLIAEAKCLRGWAYFTLTQLYGPVPLQLKATASSSDRASIYLSRSPVKDVYAQIVEDLTYASGNYANGSLTPSRLPRTRPTADLGRVTSGTAIGLLGKVYLTMAGLPLSDPNGYANAIATLAPLVTGRSSYGTGLLSSYASVFRSLNEMNSEILFALRCFGNSNVGVLSCTYFPNTLGGLGMNIDGDAGQSPMYGLRWDILRLFNPNDVRTRSGIGYAYADMRANSKIAATGLQDSLIYDTVTNFQYRRKTVPTQVVASAPGRYGLGYTKYIADQPRLLTSVRGYQNDWIVLRFSDVLLCYAEALNEAGQTAAAIPILNEVRTRANATPIALTTTQIPLRQIIRDERMRELVGEFTSVFDIRRWGTLKDEMDNMRSDQFTTADPTVPLFDPKFYLYPVPFSQLQANQNLLPQNPGWN